VPPPTRPVLLSCFPAATGGRAPWSVGRGPDLTGRAERSVRRRGPTDGPPPGTQTAPGRPAAAPDGALVTADDPLLTVDEVIAELRVSRAAFYRWRRQGSGPQAVRLPGGGVRVRRSALTAWLRGLEEQDT
jgi:excisionase family DNA binding protein